MSTIPRPRRLTFVLTVAAVTFASSACAVAVQPPDEAMGTAALPLTVQSTSGQTYRLAGRLRVYAGEEIVSTHQTEDYDDQVIIHAAPGQYSVELRAGYTLQRLVDETYESVLERVVLTTPNPQPLTIEEGLISTLSFGFAIGEEAIAFGEGQGRVQITVDDGPADCASVDACGVCDGPGIPPGQCDCEGNVVDACGVCGGDGSTCTADDVLGNYAARAVTYSFGANGDPIKTVSLSWVTIEPGANPQVHVLTDHTCDVQSRVPGQSSHAWQLPEHAQNMPPVVANLGTTGPGQYLRESTNTAVGFEPAACTSECCIDGLPMYYGGGTQLPQEPAACPGLYLDDDGDGLAGISIQAGTGPRSGATDPGLATFQTVGLTRLHWTLQVVPDGGGLTGSVGDEGTQATTIGCQGEGPLGGFACNQLEETTPSYCPEPFNPVQLIPLPAGAGCPEVLATVFELSADGEHCAP